MAQFDVYHNPNAAQRAVFPFLIQIQSDQLSGFPARLIMPLQRMKIASAALPRRLSQTVVIEGESVYLAVYFMAAIHTKLLGKPVGNLIAERSLILDAMNALVSGV